MVGVGCVWVKLCCAFSHRNDNDGGFFFGMAGFTEFQATRAAVRTDEEIGLGAVLAGVNRDGYARAGTGKNDETTIRRFWICERKQIRSE